jgi:hypothetical protein
MTELMEMLVLEPNCFDCGWPYDSYWVDCVIPPATWHLISPDGEGNGLLCFNCMAKRLALAGLMDVPLKITSGPFDVGGADAGKATVPHDT